ncbi:hypothetical protein HanRHA438_Chr17g0817051 [Helianthus annuus]|nr:hypothetical protein HanIR_Chr17g0875981 [Helianthus annuus]KAJ0826686.1 hypothetical protein HanRHA438_Chr17g0817051 [Helianthus annuus]
MRVRPNRAGLQNNLSFRKLGQKRKHSLVPCLERPSPVGFKQLVLWGTTPETKARLVPCPKRPSWAGLQTTCLWGNQARKRKKNSA